MSPNVSRWEDCCGVAGLATAEKAKVELEGLQAMERILQCNEEEKTW